MSKLILILVSLFLGNIPSFVFSESSEPTACRLPMYTGPCKAAIRMWAFKYSLGKCVPFIYGGCKGNDNKFYSQKECEEYCRVMMRRGVSYGVLRMV